MTQDITSLIEKLEGAEVGSDQLSSETIIALGGAVGLIGPLPVTTSLDAALALAERVLPSSPEPGDVPWDQWLIELTRSPVWRREVRVTWDCSIGNGLGFGGARVTSIATPALALCAAILRAQSEAR